MPGEVLHNMHVNSHGYCYGNFFWTLFAYIQKGSWENARCCKYSALKRKTRWGSPQLCWLQQSTNARALQRQSLGTHESRYQNSELHLISFCIPHFRLLLRCTAPQCTKIPWIHHYNMSFSHIKQSTNDLKGAAASLRFSRCVLFAFILSRKRQSISSFFVSHSPLVT